MLYDILEKTRDLLLFGLERRKLRAGGARGNAISTFHYQKRQVEGNRDNACHNDKMKWLQVAGIKGKEFALEGPTVPEHRVPRKTVETASLEVSNCQMPKPLSNRF